MNKTLCVKCEIIEVDEVFALCDSCAQKSVADREKAVVADAEKLIRRMYETSTDGICSGGKYPSWEMIEKQSYKKTMEKFITACKSAIIVLEFAKDEFEKSIGALILDGVFESDNDSGVGMLRLYIRDYENQISYITKTYLK